MRPVIPTKMFTANKSQFLGVITSEYRDHMKPVAVRAVDWVVLSFSTGRAMSAIPAITRAHLKAGAQKNIVRGPAGVRR